MSFEEAVASISVLKYHKGLKALGANSKKIIPNDTKKLSGSADIDSCTKTESPNDSRWDYVVGYDDKAFFVEVHPCQTSNIKEVVKKVVWLKEWLNSKGLNLKMIRGDHNFYWIASGKVDLDISKNSKYKRLLDDNNLVFMQNMVLPPRK